MHIQFQLVQQCIQISTRINSTNVHTYILRLFYIASSIRIYILIDPFLQGFVTQNATWCQNRGCICISSTRRTYGRIHSSFLHTPVIQRTIILWSELFPKKRREKIQGEILQSIFEYSGVSTNNTRTTRTTVFSHAIQPSRAILHTELILLQEILQLQGSSRAHQYKASSSDCSHVSKHSTRQNKAPSLPTALQGHTAQAGSQLILPGRNTILSGSQHPHSPYSNSQAHSYRILPREIGFFPKGSSIVCLCNTKVSVFQITYYKNINSIQGSSNSMRRYSTLSSIQVILVTILHEIQ